MKSLLRKLFRIALNPSVVTISVALVSGSLLGATPQDFYVSTNDLHVVDGVVWGTYITEDGVAHDAYTNLQAAIDVAVAAGMGNTVWVEDGFECTTGEAETGDEVSRIKVTKKMTIRSRSGRWETGAVIRGSYATNYDGTRETRCGEGAVRCLDAMDGVKLIGLRLENGATQKKASQHGGGGKYGTYVNCMVSGCGAYNEGGGLYRAAFYDGVISNCTCIGAGNTYGGGQSLGNMSNSLVVACYSTSNGGGLDSVNPVQDCEVRDCSVKNYGGGLRSGAAYRTRVLSCRSENTSGVSGVYQGTMKGGVISNCNTSAASDAHFFDVLFVDNIGSQALWMDVNGKSVTNCTFRGNAGASIKVSKALTKPVMDCKFFDSAAVNVSAGRGMFRDCNFHGRVSGAGDYYNCLFTDIQASSAAPISCSAAEGLNLYNCTVVGNTSSAANTWCVAGGAVSAYNSVVRGNSGVSGKTDAFVTAVNCCIEDAAVVTSETGCIRTDPQLILAADGLYYPSEASPCRTSGSLTAYELTELDMAGQPRMSLSAAGETTVAIGACEFDPDLMGVFLKVVSLSKYDYAPVSIDLTASSAGLGTTGLTYYWDFDGDGTTDLVSAEPRVSHRYPAGGVFHPVVAVSNATKGVVSDGGDGLVLRDRPVHYVKLGSTNPIAPYLSEETAAADIASAVGVSGHGEEVVILPGTYEIDTQICVTNDIVVRGSTGNPEDVVVHQTTYDRCFRICGGSECVVHSLVAENGQRAEWVDYGASVLIAKGDSATRGSNYSVQDGEGAISNLVIRNTKQVFGVESAYCKQCRGGAVYAQGTGARITHCVITNSQGFTGYCNRAWANGLGIHLENGARAENCFVARNFTGERNTSVPYKGQNVNFWESNADDGFLMCAVYVGSDCELSFSTVVSNEMSFCGGVSVAPTGKVKGCVIAGNRVLYKSMREANPRFATWASLPNTLPSDGFYVKDNPESGKAKFDAFLQTESEHAETAGANITWSVLDFGGGLGTGSVVAPATDIFKDYWAGDYTLARRSPARDLIDPAALSTTATTDLYGNPRLQGIGYDAGCQELPPKPGLILLVR